jgi:hypothetical protein
MPYVVSDNPHEERARQDKAYKLANTIEEHYRFLRVDSIAECAAVLSDTGWVEMSRAAFVNPPSETTKSLVIDILMRREAVDA